MLLKVKSDSAKIACFIQISMQYFESDATPALPSFYDISL